MTVPLYPAVCYKAGTPNATCELSGFCTTDTECSSGLCVAHLSPPLPPPCQLRTGLLHLVAFACPPGDGRLLHLLQCRCLTDLYGEPTGRQCSVRSMHR